MTTSIINKIALFHVTSSSCSLDICECMSFTLPAHISYNASAFIAAALWLSLVSCIGNAPCFVPLPFVRVWEHIMSKQLYLQF